SRQSAAERAAGPLPERRGNGRRRAALSRQSADSGPATHDSVSTPQTRRAPQVRLRAGGRIAGGGDWCGHLVGRFIRTGRRELSREPLTQATMFETIAQGYDRLAVRQRAEELYEKALEIRRAQQGSQHVDVGKTLLELGALRRRVRDYDGALKCFEEALAIHR